ncbi:HNH endonuclease signature motif containing protein [Arthrobacter sp. E3]|uniref:HNH endonuclease n=1 Tax=Arthrobacter sp. E3 TaxID=517402 RepID=UPI001A94934B|nr:HNH endonuclease signature motif containing protein [Arthrobacter sp. E3]
MAAREWFFTSSSDASGANGAPRGETAVQANGGAAVVPCESLLVAGASALEQCQNFFNPVVLAQLDAALASELAQQARNQAEESAGAVEQAIREGRSTAGLIHFARKSSRDKSAATKADARASLAATVVTSLGGTVAESGFDPSVVDQVNGAAPIDVIERLEQVKNAMSAVQAYAQTMFVAQQRLSQARLGVPKEKLGTGVAAQVALARHESAHRGRQLCELAEVLVREMPCSMHAFATGKINEYRASLVARETVFLSLADRARVDQVVCGDPDAAALLGSRELAAASRNTAYGLDPEAFVKRHEKAVGDRYVSLRPAAGGMTFLTALIPLKQGVRILATLTRVADSAKASGDQRGKGQLMADALMHRLIQHAPCDEGAGTLSGHRGMPVGTGNGAGAGNRAGGERADGSRAGGGESSGEASDTSKTAAAAAAAEGHREPVQDGRTGASREPWCTTVNEPDIALELVMTDRSLFGSENDPAVLVGYEAIPAPLAREMILGGGGGNGSGHGSADCRGDANKSRVWLKRLFTHPESNSLLAMDSRGRLFPEGMKEFLRVRDQRCQTPYCDAPIREYDHIKAYAAGGPTMTDNGQGLCTACNQAKEAPGWSSQRDSHPSTGLPSTDVGTPTGHRYISTAPPLPGHSGRKPSRRANRRC